MGWIGSFLRLFAPAPVIVWGGDLVRTYNSDLLTVPAIMRAISLISTDSARLQLIVRRRDGSVVDDSPVLDLLEGEQTSILSGFELRRWLACSALTYGNGYLWIRRDIGTGEPVALDPVDPPAVNVKLEGGEARYLINNVEVDDSNLIHVRAFPDPLSPWLGVSPITQCRRVLSTQAVLDQVAEELAKTGFVGKLAIEHPGPLTAKARAEMREKWMEQHHGGDKIGVPAFFGEGMKSAQLAADAAGRLLEAKKHGVEDVARAFGIPPQLLWQGEGRSQPETAQAYATHCLAPFCSGIDRELSRKLLPPGQNLHTDLTPITVGDFRTAGRAYAQLVQVGVLAPNDARRRMGLTPIDGLDEPKPVISGVDPNQNAQDAQEDADAEAAA